MSDFTVLEFKIESRMMGTAEMPILAAIRMLKYERPKNITPEQIPAKFEKPYPRLKVLA